MEFTINTSIKFVVALLTFAIGLSVMYARPNGTSTPITFQFKEEEGKSTLTPILPMGLIVRKQSGEEITSNKIFQCKVGRMNEKDILKAICGTLTFEIVGLKFEQ